jgi:SAM-dependent methyltransferase
MSEQSGPPGQESEADLAYILPRHPAEIDRLDVQHYALREHLGVNFLAPVVRPERVLDVGSGTGQWAYDVGRQFPRSLVVGVDVQPSKPGAPGNFRMVRANVLRGLPFAGGSFDFVHQRLMAISAIPLPSWDAEMADLIRVAAPGAWVELVEAFTAVEPSGPATQRMVDLTRQVGKELGVDMDAVVVGALGDHLRQAGLVDVDQRTASLPIGEWGGRVGSLNATNMRSFMTRLAGPFEERGISPVEFGELLHATRAECEELHSRVTFVFAIGRRPRAPGPVRRGP